MNEYAARFHLEPDDGYAGGVSLDRTAVVRSNVALQRRRSALVRRGPRREIVATAEIASTYSATWDFDVSNDLPTMHTAIEAMGDRGSRAAITGGNQWTIGREAGWRTFSAHTATEDGVDYTLAGGICREISLTITTGAIVAAATAWEFLTMTATPEAAADTDAAPAAFASPIDAGVTWDGTDLDTFSLAINLSRDLTIADLGEDGIPQGYSGRTIVDIAGRLIARVDAADAEDLFAGQLTREMVITIPAGATTMTITLHTVEFLMTKRRIVGAGQIEHEIEFVATTAGGLPAATITLVTA